MHHRFRTASIALGLLAGVIPTISVAQTTLLFRDNFEYVVNKNDPQAGTLFRTNGGWDGFKDMTTSNPGAGGYLYTTTAIPGFSGAFPSGGAHVLAVESKAGSEAPVVIPGYLQQTDFYLQYGSPTDSIGAIPANLWVQYWIYVNDYGTQQSSVSRSDKWLYPNRSTAYPATGTNNPQWITSVGTASHETDGRASLELGNGPDLYTTTRAYGAVYSNASEVPTNQEKLGPNLNANVYVRGNGWYLVKIHIDTSGAQGIYEQWIKPMGGDWVKTTEWIGGVTPNFTWPIAAGYRDGHRMMRVPTTMNHNLAYNEGGDSWIYLDDFTIATSEGALPVYGGGTSVPVPTPAPTLTLSASPTSITAGGSTTLTWSTTNATSCSASNGWTGTKATSGSQTITPTTNTTYTLTCTGAGGTATQSASVAVTAVVNTQPEVQAPSSNTSTASTGTATQQSSGSSSSTTAPTPTIGTSTGIGTATPPVTTTPSTTYPPLTRALGLGSKGDDVKTLQQMLAQDPTIYPEGDITGYYGPATERAVQRFQTKHAIVSSGSAATTGYGQVGPATRTKLNALYAGTTASTGLTPEKRALIEAQIRLLQEQVRVLLQQLMILVQKGSV